MEHVLGHLARRQRIVWDSTPGTRRIAQDVSLSNMFATLLNRMGVPAKSIKDSTGEF